MRGGSFQALSRWLATIESTAPRTKKRRRSVGKQVPTGGRAKSRRVMESHNVRQTLTELTYQVKTCHNPAKPGCAVARRATWTCVLLPVLGCTLSTVPQKCARSLNKI